MEPLTGWKFVLDDDGTALPCDDLVAWAEFVERGRHRWQLVDEVGDVSVSTVFLGLDHNFGRGTQPVLWETMIFGGPHDDYQARYATYAEAKVGHALAVTMARTTVVS